MMVSRRTFVHSLATLAGAGAAGRVAIAQSFPAQAIIDVDPLRPRYHLMPRRGWMNDPCAPIYFRGRYHMFFQYNPGASVWGDMHWAHAVSKDMVHWSERPVALAPTPGGPDEYGVFTGSVVLNHKVPMVLYTCVSPSTKALSTLWGSEPPEREQQCLAVPKHPGAGAADAALDIWNKVPKPVVTAPPTQMKVTGFRDPVPWQEADGSFYMLLASGQRYVGGNVLLYKSSDLLTWQFQHVFAKGTWTGKQTDDTVDSGEMWECPDFFELGGKHVLIHSTGTAQGRRTVWQTGTLDRSTMQWSPEQEGLLNHGPYYAPKTQLDASGNRILWGWIEETRPKEEYAQAGWAGCMSLPRVLTVRDGRMYFAPAQQLQGLRRSKAQNPQPLQAEIVLHLQRVPRAARIEYQTSLLRIDQQPGSETFLWNGTAVNEATAWPADLTIRCFTDHSVVEVFLGEQAVLTCRTYAGQQARLIVPTDYTLVETSMYELTSI